MGIFGKAAESLCELVRSHVDTSLLVEFIRNRLGLDIVKDQLFLFLHFSSEVLEIATEVLHYVFVGILGIDHDLFYPFQVT